jgi:uncharacterized protein (DUF433 family)
MRFHRSMIECLRDRLEVAPIPIARSDSRLAPVPDIAYLRDVTAEQKASLAGVVSVDPEIMHGTPCFSGTRVPVQTLLDYIEENDTLDDFLRDFATVKRDQAIQFLERAKDQLIECVSS